MTDTLLSYFAFVHSVIFPVLIKGNLASVSLLIYPSVKQEVMDDHFSVPKYSGELKN